MSGVIDSRLCDGMSIPEIIENFNRVLKIVDGLTDTAEGLQEAVEDLDERVTALEPEEDPGDGEGDGDGGEGA